MESRFLVLKRSGNFLADLLTPHCRDALWKGRLKRLRDCATFLDFDECPVDSRHDSRLKRANFCHLKFCPECQWRRGLKYSLKTYQVISHYLRGSPDYGVVHLTLTLKNVDDMQGVHSRLIRSFQKLRDRKVFDRCVGGIWALEVTMRGKGYHPHLHCLCLVPRNKNGLPVLAAQQALSDAWLDITGDSYIIGVRAVYDTASVLDNVQDSTSSVGSSQGFDPSSLSKAVVEVCKYPFGGVEYQSTKTDPKQILGLYKALDGLRMMGSWGCLHGFSVDESDLVHVEDDFLVNCCRQCGEDLQRVFYFWHTDSYQVGRTNAPLFRAHA